MKAMKKAMKKKKKQPWQIVKTGGGLEQIRVNKAGVMWALYNGLWYRWSKRGRGSWVQKAAKWQGLLS